MKYLNKYKSGNDINHPTCKIDPSDYDYVEDMDCGNYEMWEHCETKEKIFVPIVTNRYWYLFETKYRIEI
tara:strand:+ start:45 stop:254 length:210 start_codon:yes stop_codon:yes gene_type:complete